MKCRFRTEHLLLTMGEDFSFRKAHKEFGRSDDWIEYFNKNYSEKEGIKLIYSTPSMYLDAVKAAEIEWPVKHGDFFPYVSDEQSSWVGFFSSRPLDKAIIRRGNQVLNSAA